MFHLIYTFNGDGYIKKYSRLSEVQANLPSEGFYDCYIVLYELPNGSFISVEI